MKTPFFRPVGMPDYHNGGYALKNVRWCSKRISCKLMLPLEVVNSVYECALLTVLKWKLLMTVGRSSECAMNRGSLVKQFKDLHVASGEVGVRPTAVMIKCPQRPTSTTASLTSLHVTVRLRNYGASVNYESARGSEERKHTDSNVSPGHLL